MNESVPYHEQLGQKKFERVSGYHIEGYFLRPYFLGEEFLKISFYDGACNILDAVKYRAFFKKNIALCAKAQAHFFTAALPKKQAMRL